MWGENEALAIVIENSKKCGVASDAIAVLVPDCSNDADLVITPCNAENRLFGGVGRLSGNPLRRSCVDGVRCWRLVAVEEGMRHTLHRVVWRSKNSFQPYLPSEPRQY